MTKDQVISLYVLANGWNPEGWPNTVSELQRFANLIEDQARINEREACAKVCEAGVNNATDWDSSAWDQACENRAFAIRARGQA